MNRKLFCALVALAIAAVSCSGGPENRTAHLSGRITVADSVDASGDYSGIGVSVVRQDTAGNIRDTLFHAETDTSGNFEGQTRVPSQNRYPLLFSRNSQRVGTAPLYLSAGDSVRITADLAALPQTLEIDSREHRALELFQRLNRTFNRVRAFAQAGQITPDSLVAEAQKWSELYWDVYERHPGTIAGKMAATESIRMLESQNPDTMMRRLRRIREDEDLVGLAATHGKERMARSRGLEDALSYLDTLQRLTEGEEPRMRIRMERIKLLYDSARVEDAKTRLGDFRTDYAGNSTAGSWSESIQYDLDYLAPGDTIPTFSFGSNGGTVSRESLEGEPYILEITSLGSRLYQQQFDRTVVIHGIYKNFGLRIITIPLDDSQATVEGFFQERLRPWPVADAGEFDRDELIDRFNIRVVPTRFLVDRQGRIVRKYVAGEFQDIIQGIQTVLNEEEPAS